MMRMRAVALSVAVWAGFAPTHAQDTRVNGTPGALVAQGPTSQNRDVGHPNAKRPMTFADLMAMKRVSDPQISPGGKWVLFSVTEVDLAKNTKTNNLWVVPIDGSAPEKQITNSTGESFGRFAPNGQFVSYTGAPTKDDPYARITIAAWDETTGTIGAGRTLKAVSGDADGAVWSPDSKHFLFTTEVWPECSVVGGATPTSQSRDVGHPNTNAEILTYGQNDEHIEVGGTNNVAAWRTMQAAPWPAEDACDRVKDEAAEKNPVKAQVWDGLLYRHWNEYTGAKRTHIIEADFSLDGANPRDLTTARDVGDAETPTWMLGGPQEYAWAPDSKEIAYVTNLDPVPAASTNNDVFTLRVDEADARPVKVSTSAGSDDEPEYSPDGKWLAFRSQRQAGFESDRERLMVYDRVAKTSRELSTRWDNWIDEFVWSPSSNAVLFASGVSGEENLYGFDLGLDRAIRITIGNEDVGYQGKYHLHDGELGSAQISPDGNHAVALRMEVSRPAELVSIGLGPVTGPPHSRVERVLTRDNQLLLDQFDLPEIERFRFSGAEGTKVEGFLLKPPNFDPAKKYPVKFLLHGGPQTAWGDAWSYRWNWELMAASGYVVIGINRRGSTGYGQKFVDEVSGDWGGRAYEDLMKGLDYAEANYPFIDKTRECALGASYGGYMADWVLTHTNRFQCIVTHDGLYDAEAAYGSTEEMWFPEWEFRRPEDFPKGWDGFTSNPKQTLAGHPAEPWRYAGLPASEDPFRKWSPKKYVQNAKTPTLVIHSQKDYRLDVSQGFELYTALQRRGVPSRFLYFPDEGHWVLKPKNSELWNAVVSEWCDRWTHTGKYAEK